MTTPIITVTGLQNYLGNHWVHSNINLEINRGEVLALVGGSGCGKSTLLRSILMLQPPTNGSIRMDGEEITKLKPRELQGFRKQIGMMFQHGALFGSLTVQENVAFPLQCHTNLAKSFIAEMALLKIALVGLPLSAANKVPSELSGGMIKRAAVARAIALDPTIVFLDEPTAGLDPHGAGAMDELIRFLNKTLQLTIVLVTHDLDTLWCCADRVAFIGNGEIQAVDNMTNLCVSGNPVIKDYFDTPRAKRLQQVMAEVAGET